jgi:hypothetical protein
MEEDEMFPVVLTEVAVTLVGILLALAIFVGVWLLRAEGKLPEEQDRVPVEGVTPTTALLDVSR